MAVVGEASVIVRAVTTGVKNDIQRAFDGADRIGERAGADAGSSFTRGFRRGGGGDVASLFGKSLSQGDVDRFTAARARFLQLARAGYILAPALTAVGGVIGSLVGGLGVLISIAGAATPALLGLSGAFLAVAASAAVLRAAFGGVGEAIQAGARVGRNAAADAEALKAANDRLADAYYNLDETVRQNAERKAEAVEAESDAAQAVADAALSVERAERTYAGAVKNTEKALEEVTKAREEAKEAIQQLRFELEGGVISEKKARLEFEKARDSLQRVQDLPPNSRARREAELAFAEADLNLRRAIDKNNDLRKETAKANREGVEGSERVRNAQERLVDAQQAESDAQIDAARSVISYREAVEDLDAARAKLVAGGELDRQNARALELAYRELTNALAAQEKAAKGSGFDEYQAALDKLSPAAQDFVKYILSLKDAFEELRKKLQEAFFPKFTEAIKLLYDTYLDPNAPASLEAALIRIAAKLGELSLLFAEVFTTPKKQEEINKIFDSFTPIIDNLGRAFIDLASAFVTLQAAFTPYTIEFSAFIAKKAEAFRKTVELKEATGELAQIFEDATDIVRDLGEGFGNAFSAFGTIISATVAEGGAADTFLQWFKDVTAAWEETTKALNEEGKLAPFLNNLTIGATKVLEIIGLIGAGFLQIAASEGYLSFLDSLEKVVRIFNGVGLELSKPGGALESFGKFLEEFARLVAIVTESESINIFFGTLTGILKVLNTVLGTEFGQAVLAVTGGLLALSAAINISKTAFLFYGDAVKGALLGIQTGIFALPKGIPGVKKLQQEVAFLSYGVEFLSKRFLIISGVIGAVVGVFILAYQNSEKLREALKDMFENVLKALKKAWEEISVALNELLEPLGGVSGVFEKIGDFLAVTLVPLLEFVLVGAINIVKEVILGVIGTIQKWVDRLIGFKNEVTKFYDKVKEVFNKIDELSIGDIWSGIKDSFKSALNWVINKWNNLSFKMPSFDGLVIAGKTIIPAFEGPTLSLPYVRPLAEGGIVPAIPGGMLARIGEAGRPERVEPLDPSGLSKRDRAMIEMLAGESRGIQITVNPSSGMDERELAAMVSRQLAFQLRKGAA